MAHSIFIDGAEGTTGLQIYERLENRADITLLRLPQDKRKSLPHRLEAMQQAELTVLCLPDAAAKEIAAAAVGNSRICDASTAHRTAEGWCYGFAEFSGAAQAIQGASRVAVPGCHATGFLALVRPLVELGALHKSSLLHCHSISGYSGGGKQMIAAYEQPPQPQHLTAPRQYALGMQHKHLPEMRHVAGLSQPPLFTPIVANYYSGMLVSVALHKDTFAAAFQSKQAVHQLYKAYYGGQPLIDVVPLEDVPADGMLAANALAGRDNLEIFVLGSEQQLLLCARFDNLGKGAAGAATQCINIMLGFEPTQGLHI